MSKKIFLKFFHFDNLICILWSNLEVSYDSASLVSCWHMSRGQPSQTVLKSVHSLALYDFLKFYLIYYPTAPLKAISLNRGSTVPPFHIPITFCWPLLLIAFCSRQKKFCWELRFHPMSVLRPASCVLRLASCVP